MYRSSRLCAVSILFTGILAAFSLLLWNLQVTHGAEYLQKSRRSIALTEIVPAARGKLLDRDGRILARDTALRTAEESSDSLSFSYTVERVGSGSLAPHVLGRVGKLSPAEWETYGPLGYSMDSVVGKDGAEAAFEELLHGVPGKRLTQLDRDGNPVDTVWATLPRRGKNVTLTLDAPIQKAAGTALSAFLNAHPTAVGGSVVVLDVNDGGVLAMVSLPGYDTETFPRHYPALAGDSEAPLMNRAVQGLYAPGSTFKLVTATAALEEGVLTPKTQILDTGRYTYYKTPQPQCWLYRQEGRTHGLETVSEAIADSCNIFFYDAGRRVGIETLEAYAHAFGLGEKTGIELKGEKTGVVAGPSYTESIGGTWYEGNVLSAAIGQENNRFTPLQLAQMTAILCNGGHRWQVHLLKQVEGEKPYERTLLGTVRLSEENAAAIKEGMLSVTRTGSLSAAFSALPVQAGAKTGSAQVTGAETSNAVLVCFAPYEDPEVAVAIVAERGGSGAALGRVAAAVLNACFSRG